MLSAIILLAGDGSTPWWNYPGFEVWRFMNLGIFILVLLLAHRYLLGNLVTEGLRARKDQIKRDLAHAREERDQALQQLADVEARLERLDDEVNALKAKATAEAEAEESRLQQATEAELKKLRENARREIESASKAAAVELRRFAAGHSISLAETIIRREIKPEDDARLMNLPIDRAGGRPS